MTSIRPFLGTARRMEIDRAIASWGHRPARGRRQAHCTVEQCGGPGWIRGLCRRHYNQWWKAVRRGTTPSVNPEPIAARFPTVDLAACESSCILSWLAGLLEGEGTFGLNGKAPRAYPVISVEMCDFDVVSRAANVLGAASVQLREPDEARWNLTYVAAIVGKRAAEWMRTLRPCMGLRRGAAIDAALVAYQPIRLIDPPETCLVDGCKRPHRSRGLCNTHYMSWSRDLAKGRTPRVTPLR